MIKMRGFGFLIVEEILFDQVRESPFIKCFYALDGIFKIKGMGTFLKGRGALFLIRHPL